MVIFHKPDEKAELAIKSGFKGVGTKAMLFKQYPADGGILFRRYYGIGVGILVGEDEMESMMGECDIGEWTVEMTHASCGDLITGQVVALWLCALPHPRAARARILTQALCRSSKEMPKDWGIGLQRPSQVSAQMGP